MKRSLIQRARTSSDAYGGVLALILVGLWLPVLAPDLAGLAIVVPLVLSLSAVTALRASRVPPWLVWLAVGLMALVVVASALPPLTRPDLQVAAWMAAAVLLLVAPLSILNRIARHRHITARTVLGAICIYLQIGVAYAGLYRAIDLLNDAAISGAMPMQPTAYHYFSFIVLTTVGFGDILPTTNMARTLAYFEALIGQVFLVTVVARIVAMLGRDRGLDERVQRRIADAVQRGELDIEALPEAIASTLAGDGGGATDVTAGETRASGMTEREG